VGAAYAEALGVLSNLVFCFVLLQMEMEFCREGITTKVKEGGKIHEPKTAAL
jgi:hypothetical protein